MEISLRKTEKLLNFSDRSSQMKYCGIVLTNKIIVLIDIVYL